MVPDKLYYKIGEVSKITGLPAYVLRFWETEFSHIRPKRTASGQRRYRKNDVEMILKVKHLLHDRKFTIRGARQHLGQTGPVPSAPKKATVIEELRTELAGIRELLKD
jgi:DNA-binding transcriptional MerR regulator